jgi:hypothetical protein
MRTALRDAEVRVLLDILPFLTPRRPADFLGVVRETLVEMLMRGLASASLLMPLIISRSIDLLHDSQCNASNGLFELCGYPSSLLNLPSIYIDLGRVLTRTEQVL